MQPARDGIRRFAEGVEVLAIEEGNAIVEGEAFAGSRFCEDFLDCGSHGVIHMKSQVCGSVRRSGGFQSPILAAILHAARSDTKELCTK